MTQRENYGRLKEVIEIPDLIEIQTASYNDFLQLDVPPEQRANKGLQKVFADIFPSRRSGVAGERDDDKVGWLEFDRYEMTPPKMSIVDCLKDGLTYQGGLYTWFRYHSPGNKEIKEEKIFMGDMPFMTDRGSFIINGAERVLVSQLHRSPGVCFESTRHPSGRMLFSYKIIADHGSWLEVHFDINDLMHIYLDRKRRRRKFLISTFLRAFGFESNEELVEAVYRDGTPKRLFHA